jgi:uncharacterized protein YndB with AHSA1/START domain
MLITIQTKVAVNLAKAWESWTSPEHITQWNQASEDWHCPSASNDITVGGKMISRMEAKDGSMGFDFEGTYTEVIPQKKLVILLGDGRHMSVLFEEVDNEVLVTENFETEDVNPIEMQQAGWQLILDSYARHTNAFFGEK